MRALAALAVLLLAGCADLASDAGDAPTRFDAIKFETELGEFTAILYCDETPKTCEFIRGLVESGYYDGRTFGRVIPGFVIQEVDRTGGTTDQTQTVEGEFGRRSMFSAGALGIARGEDPDSGGSEFFVMDFATSHLYGNFTAFGQVVEGLDVVHDLARVPAARTGPLSAVGAPAQSPVVFGVHDRVPLEPPVMTRVTMTTLDLPASEAARYPLYVGESTTTDAYRATLEWRADIAPGRESELTWYVYPRDTSAQGSLRDAPPVDMTDARVEVRGPTTYTQTLTESDVRGILPWRWTPAAEGVYMVRLMRGVSEIAAATVVVR